MSRKPAIANQPKPIPPPDLFEQLAAELEALGARPRVLPEGAFLFSDFKTKLGLGDNQARTRLQRLREAGIIVSHGDNRGRYWQYVDSANRKPKT
jgi:hypothetical protein